MTASWRKSVKKIPADSPGECAVVHGDGGWVAGVVLGDGARRVRRRHLNGDCRAENLQVGVRNSL